MRSITRSRVFRWGQFLALRGGGWKAFLRQGQIQITTCQTAKRQASGR